jgi:uncharacterized repeat protein (TIGR01451 family)
MSAQTLRLLAILAFFLSGAANAASYTLPSAFGSAPFAACSAVGGTYYRCTGNVALGNGDTLTIASPLTMEVTGSFTAGNGLSIVSGGNAFQIYALGNIVIGNNLAGAMQLRAGGSIGIGNNGSLTGNIVAGGMLTLDTNTVVTGACSPTHAQCTGGTYVAPALTFTKTASASSVDVGGAVSFTVRVRNDGTVQTLQGVTVTDTFPCSGLTRGTPAASQGSVTTGTCSGGSETLVWNAGNIAPGASATLTLPATGATPGSWVNAVGLTSPSVLLPPPAQNAIVTVNAPVINQVKMEVGDLTVIDTYSNPVWTQVNFTQVFDRTPFVFTLPTDDGSNAGAHRIRNVTATGFQVTTVEPGRLDGRDGEDGPHVAMGLSYLAIDSCPGGAAQCTLTLSNGDKWQLGFVNTSRAQAYGTDKTDPAFWESVTFSPAFSAVPAVLVQVQTLNNETGIFNAPGTNCPTINGGRGPCPSTPWLTSAVNNVSTMQMDIALDRSEARWGSVTGPEAIAYLAAVPTAGRAQFLDGAGNPVKYEIIRTPAQYRGWDNGFVTQNYSATWAPDVPKVVASMNSRNNLESGSNNTTGDGGWLRRDVESTANQQTRIRMTVDEVRTGSYNSDGDRTKNTPESAGIFAFNRGFAIDPVKLDHIRIVHDGAAQSCLDEPIIIKACGDAACNASTLYAGPVTASLQPNNASATWTGPGVSGTTLDFTGGSAAVNLRYSTAGTITLGLTATPLPTNGVSCYTPAGSPTSCNMTVTACASQLVNACEGATCNCTATSCAANYDRLYTKLTGTTASFGLVALRQVSGQYVLDTGFNGTVQADLVANQGAGACATPASVSGLPGSAQNVTFSGGRPAGGAVYAYAAASNTVPYRNLRLRFTQGAPATSSCSLDNFAMRPQSFTVTSTNASNNGATGLPVFRAGADSFNLTATAMAGYDGTPQIDSTRVIGSPMAGTINGSFGAAPVATGAASGNAFTYSEVGNVGLDVGAIYDDVFTTVDQPNDCTDDASNTLVGGKYGCRIGNAAVAQTTGSSGFGRFIPNHFVLSAAGVTLPGGSFGYMDQPFGINFTLTATNAGGGMTQNYAGSYAKLNPATTTWWPAATLGATGFALGARNNTADLSSRLSVVGTPGGSWTNGAVAVTANLKLSRPVTPAADATWGPYETLDIGIAPQDADGVKLLTAALNLDADGNATNERQKLTATPVKQRFGRLRLLNAHGSELLPLRVEGRVEYWDGSRWSLNVADGSTIILSGGAALSGGIAANTCFLANPPPANPTNAACLAASPLVTLTGGKGEWVVFDRITPVAGYADLAVNLATTPWLLGYWSGSGTGYNENPVARVRFGSPKAPYIYLRERY